MAKEDSKEDVIKQRKAKEKQERKEQERSRKEKETKKKLREKRKKKREDKEKKRIKTILNFPYKTLMEVCATAGLVLFIILYFGTSLELAKSIFYTFMVFMVLYFGIGIVMLGIFLIMSFNKEKEAVEKRRIEDEQRKLEEQKRAEEDALIDKQLEDEQAKHEKILRDRPEDDVIGDDTVGGETGEFTPPTEGMEGMNEMGDHLREFDLSKFDESFPEPSM